ncbi:unnamed protein product [Didymodactylos carnosus]|uniref:Mediator of RNA polymerase II transcription subunit 17 n=2 Tax=Didymodactylos carnosus TaxID=1234261 RepID=A0A813YZ47_9BILA|nr:unnamed protein product [Didymodactylos carnosus]CAF3675387.1 unnamed protein product [Didymodactylos carnosus]
MEIHDPEEDGSDRATSENGLIHEEQRKTSTTTTAKTSTFETFFEQMREAYIEICVLHDILTLVQHKGYFQLSPNIMDSDDGTTVRAPREQLSKQQSQDTMYKTWISKRMSCKSAGAVLLASYERFMKIINKTTDQFNSYNPNGIENFHVQLSNLRQRWKIKKQQNSNRYLGDLSFRSAGSFFPIKMQFEVCKTEYSSKKKIDRKNSNRTSNGSIEIKLPEELQVRLILKIEIDTKDGESLLRSYTTMMASGFTRTTNTQDNSYESYDSLLENAQRTIFLKELFSHLCREASDIVHIIQPKVSRNAIKCWISPDTLMSISLLRENEFNNNNSVDNTFGAHVGLLEHSLCALLRQQYFRNYHYSQLKPSTLMLGVPTLRRLAGINAFNHNQLVTITESKTILQTIIDHTQHMVVRTRVLKMFDRLAENCDINMIINVSAFSTTTTTFGRIHLVYPGYDALCRWSYIFQIEDSRIRIQYKSRFVEFVHHIEQVQRFLISQIAWFKFTVHCALAKVFGWIIVGSTIAPTVKSLCDVQFSAQLEHPHVPISVGLRIGTNLQIQIGLNQRRSTSIGVRGMDDDTTNSRRQTSNNFGIKYEDINLDNYCGTSNLQRFEIFITALVNEEKQR